MTQRQDNAAIAIIHPVCCGLDVHKEKISACLMKIDEQGREASEIREFATFTDELIKLREWLRGSECPIVAMESTGVYWRPVHNVLEHHLEVIVVNARHIKNVPGRKTDIADSRWLASLLKHGLLRGSFIPSKDIRQWRELSRQRRKVTESLSDYKKRVHKLFETANIKIASVVSDLFGKTGRRLIEQLCDESASSFSEQAVAGLACGRLRAKAAELYRSIQGYFEGHHRFQLCSLMRIITILESEIGMISDRLQLLMKDHDELLGRVAAIPGIGERSAQMIISEVGYHLDSFTDAASFASWAGLCPGNNESAGKRRSGRTAVQKHPFKTIMVEVAWAAVKTKGSYFKDKYHRLKSRRGAKKAIVAIAHRLVKALFQIIKHGERYRELGEGYLKSRKRTSLRALRHQAQAMGFQLVPVAE
ncbi:IS110 family transposase [Desulfoprunum benzoelyticum]|uniref:Transposase n=1 Tax=Desulfoprunum benzoelyticum TaxID=1506996 RepID=A0A840URV0_9BACT|nr:IS110 family transposase [Desulfoprunum benzoelyticum]MBB5348947.1 transposase [Desulfoprunum benzoelyticum]MBM9530801.1 IS110 family transposase [Desulfoprunum benzoelyticum]